MLQEKRTKQGYLTLRDYQKYLKELYVNINKNRTFENLYSYLDRTVAYLGKDFIRYERGEGFPKSEEFVLPISWLLAVSSNLGLDIEEPFLRKYPNICFYCLEKPCICHKTQKKPRDPNLPAYKIGGVLSEAFTHLTANSTNKFTLDKAAEMVDGIYTVNEIVWKFWGPWYHIAKLHEEIAEIHEANDAVQNEGRQAKALEDEISDVLAWLLTAWKITNPNASLDDAFIDYYINNCRLCRDFPCKCQPNASRTPSLANLALIPEIIEHFEAIKSELPEFELQINENLRSLRNSLSNQVETIAKTALLQSSQTLNEIEIYIVAQRIDGQDATKTDALSNQTIVIELIRATKLKILISLDEESKKELDFVEFDAFIIHSDKDYHKAHELYLFLKQRSKRIFLSRDEIRPGDDIEGLTKKAHRGSKCFLFLATRNSLSSEWVGTEWGGAWFQDRKIIPVLYRCDVDELPERLRRIAAVDFGDMEQIASLL